MDKRRRQTSGTPVRVNAVSAIKNKTMIQIRIKQLMKERGIKFPLETLKKAGISQGVAQGYLNGTKTWLLHKHAEKLCKLLRCTPNDLYEWTPDDPSEDYPENLLQAIRKKPSVDLEEKLKNMTLEEIRKKFG